MKRNRPIFATVWAALISLALFIPSPASAQKPTTATTRTRGEEKRRLEIIRRQNEQLRHAAKLTLKARQERERRVQATLHRQAAGEKRRQEVVRQEIALQDPAKRGIHQIEEKRQDDLRQVQIARQRRPMLLRKAAREQATAAERKRRIEKARKKPATHRP